MSLKSDALGFADSLIGQIADRVERRILDREDEPLRWYLFHDRLARSLPRWRWLARAHHKRMARRYRALLLADGMDFQRCGLE